MSVSAAPAHDRGYHPLPIKRVVRETAEAASIVFDIPAELATSYRYQAGQFLTFRVTLDGQTVYRSYSMSSAPAVDGELAVTVKRVPGGRVSNWIVDELSAGDTIDASVPAGVFRLPEVERDVLGFAAGSGVTPVFSILKQALASTERRVQLLYANQDSDSIIFAAELDRLTASHGERLAVEHHLDCDRGFVDAASVAPYLEAAKTSDCFICGPAPFMDIVETALLDGGVPVGQIHIERFTVVELAPPPVDAGPPPTAKHSAAVAPPAAGATEVTIELDGQTKTAAHHPGTTILQTARSMGLKPPSSCEAGNCATCMAKLLDGEVKMHVNDALFEDEVADGWILTCQSVPTTPTVHVVYGYEGT
jgi:ferredoxin-NADP reductase